MQWAVELPIRRDQSLKKHMSNTPRSNSVRKIARITAKQGKASLLQEALRTLEAATSHESGCIEFAFYQALTEEGSFVLLEHFVDAEAFSAHIEMPHTKVFFQAALVERVNAVDVPSLGVK